MNTPTAPTDDVVLLTGIPSLLARAVCAEVVRADPRAVAYAIIRSKFADAVRAMLEGLPADHRARIRIVEGDPSAIDFGLSGPERKALVQEVTRIHHCSQVTYLGVDRKVAEEVNVRGAAEALEFATDCAKLQCLVFHSTAQVAGDRRGHVLESELKEGQAFRNVVEETQARAEKLMRAAMARLPIAVMRPATIVGDSNTGEIDRFDGPYLLILLALTSSAEVALPLPALADAPVNLVPIDWVARASVALGGDPRARGLTFHLVDPAPLTARRVLELVSRAAGRRAPGGSLPSNLARALQRMPGLDRFVKSPRALFEAFTIPVRYDVRNATDLLESLGVGPCPPLEMYVDKLVSYAQDRMHETPAPRSVRMEHEDGVV